LPNAALLFGRLIIGFAIGELTAGHIVSNAKRRIHDLATQKGETMARRDEIAKTPLTPALAPSALVTPSDHIDGSAAIVAAPPVEQEQFRLKVQKQILQQTEQQALPEHDQMVRPRAHPSHYPPNVDVRSRSSASDSDRK
jgi:hypothetical protein